MTKLCFKIVARYLVAEDLVVKYYEFRFKIDILILLNNFNTYFFYIYFFFNMVFFI